MESTQPVQDFAFRRVGRGRLGRDQAHAMPVSWGIDGVVRVVDRNDRSKTRRIMWACWFCAVVQELFDAVAAAEITEKLGLHNSRHGQWFSRSGCADADDGFLKSLDQISRTLSSWN